MAFNKNDLKKAESHLRSLDFEKKSDGSMTNGKVDAKVSPSGGSISLGSNTYTDLSGLKNSKHLK